MKRQHYILSANSDIFMRRVPAYDIQKGYLYTDFGFREDELRDLFYPDILQQEHLWEKLAATHGGVSVERKLTFVTCSPDNAPDFQIATGMSKEIKFTKILLVLKEFLSAPCFLYYEDELICRFSYMMPIVPNADDFAQRSEAFEWVRGYL